MSGLGGLLGVVTGISGAKLLPLMTSFTTMVQPSSVLLSLGFSAGVGIFFGYYPALRASRLEPMSALREE